jgi:hypothetical protein
VARTALQSCAVGRGLPKACIMADRPYPRQPHPKDTSGVGGDRQRDSRYPRSLRSFASLSNLTYRSAEPWFRSAFRPQPFTAGMIAMSRMTRRDWTTALRGRPGSGATSRTPCVTKLWPCLCRRENRRRVQVQDDQANQMPLPGMRRIPCLAAGRPTSPISR